MVCLQVADVIVMNVFMNENAYLHSKATSILPSVPVASSSTLDLGGDHPPFYIHLLFSFRKGTTFY